MVMIQSIWNQIIFPVRSVDIKIKHRWYKSGNYVIKAKSKDVFDEESDWGILDITVPRNKVNIRLLFLGCHQLYPNAFPLLRNILGL